MINYGQGLFNTVLNNLPVELHIPGYQFCGPGTKLAKRLSRGDSGTNPLDSACKKHDVVYSENRENMEMRKKADELLANKAWSRFQSRDASVGERAAALSVASAMKLKRRFGLGLKKVSFKSVMNAVEKSMKFNKNAQYPIKSALKGARGIVQSAGRKITIPRIISVPAWQGGALLFLIPLFAGLSATGALAGGAANIIKAVNLAKAAKKDLKENERHDRTMGSIALGKGLYIMPHRTGLALFLKPYKGKGLCKKKS